ncbi:MAG: hypothetical protein ACLVJ6_04955 [Merdibacter sp.]
MKQHSLLTAPIRRLYLGFLVPTLIATVSNSLYCLADVYFISIGSGTMGLAALNIVMPMYTFIRPSVCCLASVPQRSSLSTAAAGMSTGGSLSPSAL